MGEGGGWAGLPGALRTVATSGMTPPAGSAPLSGFDRLHVAANGDALLRARLAGDRSYDEVVWLDRAGSIEAVAVEGQAGPPVVSTYQKIWVE